MHRHQINVAGALGNPFLQDVGCLIDHGADEPGANLLVAIIAPCHLGEMRLLADEVFIHRGGIPDWDHWPDIATIGIPNYYSWVYLALIEAARATDDVVARDRYEVQAQMWQSLGTPDQAGL